MAHVSGFQSRLRSLYDLWLVSFLCVPADLALHADTRDTTAYYIICAMCIFVVTPVYSVCTLIVLACELV